MDLGRGLGWCWRATGGGRRAGPVGVAVGVGRGVSGGCLDALWVRERGQGRRRQAAKGSGHGSLRSLAIHLDTAAVLSNTAVDALC